MADAQQSQRFSEGPPSPPVHPTELKYLISNPIALNFPTASEEGARAMPAAHLLREIRAREGCIVL